MQCAVCKEKFAALKGFDAHRDSRRNKCIPPDTLGMIKTNDVWTRPAPPVDSGT